MYNNHYCINRNLMNKIKRLEDDLERLAIFPTYFSGVINKSQTYYNINDIIILNEDKNKGFTFINNTINVKYCGLYKMNMVLYPDKASDFPMIIKININGKNIVSGITSVQGPLVIETIQTLNKGDKIQLTTGSTNVVLSGISHALFFDIIQIDYK